MFYWWKLAKKRFYMPLICHMHYASEFGFYVHPITRGIITSGVRRPTVTLLNEIKFYHFSLTEFQTNWVATFLGRSHRSSLKINLKCQRSRSQVKSGKSHFGPFDPFKIHRFQRNWVWTSSATFVKIYYTGFYLRLKVKVADRPILLWPLMTIVTNETKFSHFHLNRSSPNWVGTIMGRSHTSSSKETLKGQSHRGQVTKITLWPFWPLSSAGF